MKHQWMIRIGSKRQLHAYLFQVLNCAGILHLLEREGYYSNLRSE